MTRKIYVAAFFSELNADPFRDLDEIDADAHEAARRYHDRSGDWAPVRVLGPATLPDTETPERSTS